MKEALSSFDIMASVRELRALVGGHIDKVYHPSLDHLVLAIRLPGEGRSFLHFWVGKWLYRSDHAKDMPQQPSDFTMMLRKRISNARILDIKQQGFDRIAVVPLEKEGRFDLILEMFSDGNIILVKDGIIVQPLTSHTWKHRDVRARKEFLFPPPVPDPSKLTKEELLTILRDSDTDLVRTLATKLNTGGRYSEEILKRAGMDGMARASIATPEDSQKILGTIASLVAEIISSVKGFIVLKDGAVEDVVPVRMRIYDALEHEEFATFSEAIESYIARLPKTRKERPKEAIQELDRLKRKLAQQEAAVRALQDEARETQIVGDFVFANYADVAKILSEAKEGLLESKDLSRISGFVRFNPRTSILKIAVRNVELELDVKGSVESNAQKYYEGAKRARKKLEGVLAAVENAKKEISAQESGMARAEAPARQRREPTKRFWFERFRWFISSEGAIVLGGKDAKSNDLLVKKHLEPGDRYAHADVHGAPSVVVKMKEGVSEKTLIEACEFAVATSKAWNAKIGSAAGYWVLPEQVSKTPQSGEYLPKGAFVIRGKRNYSDKIEIKLGMGEIAFEGHRKIMCAPLGAIKAHCKTYVVIRPGNTDRNAFAKQLAENLEVPIEEIQSIMPPGDVDVVEQAGDVIS